MRRTVQGVILVDVFSGTGAMTTRAFGAPTPPVPGVGCKSQLAGELLSRLLLPGERVAGSVMLERAPAHGWTAWIGSPTGRGAVSSCVRALGAGDPREAYSRMRGRAPSENPVESAAEGLLLHAWTYRCRLPTMRDGVWSTAGFDASRAYDSGAPGTKQFRRATTADVVADRLLNDREFPAVLLTGDAVRNLPAALSLAESSGLPVRVYFDPPYAGTLGFGTDDAVREEVVWMGRLSLERGHRVGVSEASPVEELAAEGWHSMVVERIGGSGRGVRTFANNAWEYLTLSPPPPREPG